MDRARETVLARLAKVMGMTELKRHIKFEIAYQPKVWQERFNLKKGAAFRLSHNFWQVGYLRPQNRHTKYKNLYFAGASTHPGTGLPIVLLYRTRSQIALFLKVESAICDRGYYICPPDH